MGSIIRSAAILCLLGAVPYLWADAGPSMSMYQPRTGTVQAGPLTLSLDNVIFTQKQGYAHVLWDAYPSAKKIQDLGLANLSPVAAALLNRAGVLFPREKEFKLDVVELPQRDDYGAPRWDQIVLKEKYKGHRKGKKIQVEPLSQGSH